MGRPAATIGSMHICPKVNPGPVPHVGGPIVQGSGNVSIGGLPAARVGDSVVCVGPPDKITSGSSGVFINGKPAARMGDSTAHGGKIVIGNPTVLIGDGGGVIISTTALAKSPESKKEALQRIEQATKAIQACRETNQKLPTSPYTTSDKANLVKEGLSEKFIVRIIDTKYAGDTGNIGYLPEGATTATYWTTTFTQLEYADSDAELICKAVGIDYDPEASYTLLLIDQEQANAKGDMLSFIPTYSNLSGFTQQELAGEFEGNEHLIAPCMTAQYSEHYEQVCNTAEQDGVNLNDKKKFNKHAKNLGFDKDQRRLLQVRHKMNKILGANEHFLGNGMTKDITNINDMPPFGTPDEDQYYGPLETFTYDKNPETLGKLEQLGIVTRIALKNA